METENNGFIYVIETKEIITDFPKGVKIYFGNLNNYFYGTKEEAIVFGLIFEE